MTNSLIFLNNTINKYIDFMISLLERYYKIVIFIIIILSSFNLFYNLNANPIEDWDESRHGVSAYEMLINKNYILTTYDDQPDYFNLKPPLGIWLIAIAYKLFGFTPFALRFFSAASALLCIILVAKIAKDYVNKSVSIISSLILATTTHYLLKHSGRTGDLDTQLTLLITLGVFFLIKSNNNKKYLYLTCLTFSLAFLVKSFAAFQLLFIFLLYLILTKMYKRVTLLQYSIMFLIASCPIIIWGILRYYQDGLEFLKTQVLVDLLQRSTTSLASTSGSIFTYFQILYNYELWVIYFIWILAYFIFTSIFRKISFRQIHVIPNVKLLLILWLVVPLTIFSFVKTKYYWYITPIYPPLSILIGWLTYKILKHSNISIIRYIVILGLVFVFYSSECAILKDINNTNISSSRQILTELRNIHPNKSNVSIYSSSWSQSDYFQAKVLFNYTPKTIIISKNSNLGLKKEDYLLIANSPNNLKLLKKNHMVITANNSEWLLAKPE